MKDALAFAEPPTAISKSSAPATASPTSRTNHDEVGG
jgi:hypothetical protein